MEFTGDMFGVSFKKTPRYFQAKALKMGMEEGRTKLLIQQPTGYGKTFVAAALYSLKRAASAVNRLLYIVNSLPQLDQIIKDLPSELVDAGISDNPVILDIGFSPVAAIRNHRNNYSHVFATTIQALMGSTRTVWDTIYEMMKQGRWMLVVDEYQHYGTTIGKNASTSWGTEIQKVNSIYQLAMSATPYRKYDDSAFGLPDMTVKYRDALEEGAVKPLRCHSYVYKIDAIDKDGNIKTYTTEELVREVGSDSPEAIERMMIERQMRWSPKYVSPLVDIPIARMERNKNATGLPLQALVGALCCSHAQLVYEQIKSMFPYLRVDWVGTGPNGRPQHENEEILNKFCPPKRDGIRHPADIQLDILIHVAMAGEGLDSVYVTEVIHLNPANINNQNNQENGRAARAIPSVFCPDLVIGYINVDSCSEYARFTGEKIMDLLDDPTVDPKDLPDDTTENGDRELELPEEPKVGIWDMECIRIDEGEIRRFAMALLEEMPSSTWDESVLDDPEHPIWAKAEEGYRRMRQQENEKLNEKSIVQQLSDRVESALTAVTGSIIKRMRNEGDRTEKSLAGDIKKRINQAKYSACGPKKLETTCLKLHYKFLRELQQLIFREGVPEWLK